MREKIPHLLFVASRRRKSPVFQLWQDFHGNSARHVNAAARQRANREISRFRSVNLRPQIQCCRRTPGIRRKALCWVISGAGSWFGSSKPGMLHRRVQKLVDVLKSAPGKKDFCAHVIDAPSQKFPQFRLLRRVRRKIRVPSFGAHRQMFRAVPEKNRFAQACSGRDHHAGRGPQAAHLRKLFPDRSAAALRRRTRWLRDRSEFARAPVRETAPWPRRPRSTAYSFREPDYLLPVPPLRTTPPLPALHSPPESPARFPAAPHAGGSNSVCARHVTSLPCCTSNKPIFAFVPPISPARIMKLSSVFRAMEVAEL